MRPEKSLFTGEPPSHRGTLHRTSGEAERAAMAMLYHSSNNIASATLVVVLCVLPQLTLGHATVALELPPVLDRPLVWQHPRQ